LEIEINKALIMKRGFFLTMLALNYVTSADDIDVITWNEEPFKPLKTIKWQGKVPSTGRYFSAYMAKTYDNSLFSFVMPKGGC
jgi:hypothetical protein